MLLCVMNLTNLFGSTTFIVLVTLVDFSRDLNHSTYSEVNHTRVMYRRNRKVAKGIIRHWITAYVV